VLVRRVQSEAGAKAAALEEVAVIARRSVEGLLEGRTIGMEPVARPTLPPPPAQPPAPAARRERPLARTSLALSGNGFAPTTPWQVGLALGVAWSPAERFFLGVGYAFVAPVDIDGGRAAARISRHPFELGFTFEAPVGPLVIGAELLGELDPLAQTTTSVAPGVRPAPDAVRWLGAAGGRARVAYPFAHPFSLFASGGVDVLLNGFQYVIEGASSGTILLSPNRIRPRVDLGLTVDIR
jgi:hypothetical protein